MQNILNSSNLKLNKRIFCLKYGSRLNCKEMLAHAQKTHFSTQSHQTKRFKSFRSGDTVLNCSGELYKEESGSACLSKNH